MLGRTPRLLGSWAEWLAAYPDADRDIAASGYEAFAAVPVIGGGRVLAALSASFRRPIVFDEGTRTFLAILGEQCGLALERARAYDAERRARETSAFVAEASRLLAASLDYETTLRTLAESAVPRLGDWCAVDLVRDPTAPTWPPTLDRVAVVHQDPEKVALAATMAARYPTDWSAEQGMSAVIRDGTPLFMPAIPDALLVAAARDAEHLALLRSLRFSSLIAVPLVARGLTLGALTLCHDRVGPPLRRGRPRARRGSRTARRAGGGQRAALPRRRARARSPPRRRTREEPVPGDDEPRAAHAAQRDRRPRAAARAGAARPGDRRRSARRSRASTARSATCSGSSTTC